jgi:hypothetical protein
MYIKLKDRIQNLRLWRYNPSTLTLTTNLENQIELFKPNNCISSFFKCTGRSGRSFQRMRNTNILLYNLFPLQAKILRAGRIILMNGTGLDHTHWPVRQYTLEYSRCRTITLRSQGDVLTWSYKLVLYFLCFCVSYLFGVVYTRAPLTRVV